MWVIAHRGDSASQPENTAAAFDAAVAAGAHGIELDLQLTRDGVVVVWHDRHLRRLGVSGPSLRHCDWPTLATLDAGRWWAGHATEHRLLRLETVLERWGGVIPLYLELKRYAGPTHQWRLARQVVSLLRRHRLSREASVLSFDSGTLRAVHEAAPEVALVRNAKWPFQLRRVAPIAAHCAGVCVRISAFRPSHVAGAHRAGLPVYTYTCDTADHFRRARRLGAWAVITNRPAEALESAELAPDD